MIIKVKYLCLVLLTLLLSDGVGAMQRDTVLVRTGRVDSTAYFTPFYTSFDVPEGVTRIHIKQHFNSTGIRRGNLDLGLFDERGTALDSPDSPAPGFRGWSGGARREVFVASAEATPGYLAGAICPGRWSVVQMSTTRGAIVEWLLEITLTFGGGDTRQPLVLRADTLVNSAAGEYRIAPHVHTCHSDGALTPAEVVALAHAEGLDGIVSTEHNTTSALREWGRVQHPDLLVIEGQEVTYADGHWNVLGMHPEHWVDFRGRSADTARFRRTVAALHAQGALTVANHPCDIAFRHDASLMDGIEVWNAEWDARDERALVLWDSLLRAGHRITAFASTDFHRGQQIASPHLVVHAEALSSSAILRALKAGDVDLVADTTIRVRFEVQDKNIVFQTDTPGCLSLYSDAGCFYRGAVARVPLPAATRWVRAELRDAAGGMIALTNPIYIDNQKSTTNTISRR